MSDKKTKKEIKSPLRYPGGKSRSLRIILPHISQHYKEFRDPFVGGGSVFLAAMQRINATALYKINDLNYDLYCFWKELKGNGNTLIKAILKMKNAFSNGKLLYQKLTKGKEEKTDLERAIRFFILNRITFSGMMDSGGYSEQAFQKRFTDSSIERLKPLPKLLKNVLIEHGDYEKQVLAPGKDVFIFLDPPYFSTAKSKLYGENGDLHTSFNHNEFAENMKKCTHRWLITYDDSEEIHALFSYAYIYKWTAKYGMNNVFKKRTKKGRELFITNYKLQLNTIDRYNVPISLRKSQA